MIMEVLYIFLLFIFYLYSKDTDHPAFKGFFIFKVTDRSVGFQHCVTNHIGGVMFVIQVQKSDPVEILVNKGIKFGESVGITLLCFFNTRGKIHAHFYRITSYPLIADAAGIISQTLFKTCHIISGDFSSFCCIQIFILYT